MEPTGELASATEDSELELEHFEEGDAPRTIRFRTREFEGSEESEEAGETAEGSYAEEDDVEYEDDDSEYEVAAEQEEEPATIKISSIF